MRRLTTTKMQAPPLATVPINNEGLGKRKRKGRLPAKKGEKEKDDRDDGMAVKADVFAGSIAAELTTKALLHPLDTIKTRLQYTVIPKRQRAGAFSIPVPAFVEEQTRRG